MQNEFQKRILKDAWKKETNLVFNLDISKPISSERDQQNLLQQSFQICRGLRKYVAAIKVNRPLIDAVGLYPIKQLIKEVKVPFIADFKLADITYINNIIAEHAFNVNFSAITAHAFIGSDPIQAMMKEFPNKGIILVVTQEEANSEFLAPNLIPLSMLAKDLGAAGVTVPSARPDDITQVRSFVGDDILIFAANTQGNYGEAVKAGANFETIGRAIYNAPDPAEAALTIMERIREAQE
ncbi:MAG: orotidine 5'-phosphate decarboxylase [DPANN group archaeon]|nr:orotidine 5'-phosphate decarboxylase [DPANN group archaeon]